MVPDGWQQSAVGQSCNIKNNLRLPINSDERKRMNGPYPYFGPTGILDYIDHYRIDCEFAIIGEDGDHFLKHKEKEMTLIFSGKANVNNHAHIITDSSFCLARWFHVYFVHRDITAHLTRQGAKRYKLTKAGLEKLPILLPPVVEQNKITKILSTWDQAVTTAEQLIVSSQRQKKALAQQLLTGKRRLNRFQCPWGTFRLDQLFSRVTAKNIEANTNVVTISAQHGLIRQEDFFNKTVASETLDNYFLLKKGQFAYNKSYSNGYPMGAIKRLNKYEKGVVTTLYICFEASDETLCNSEFFEHYFESGFLNHGLSKVANEGGRAHGLLNVKPSDFFGLTVFVPEVDEQIAIAAVLTAADQEIQTLQAKLACLKKEKKALMQQLLTGKRRVKVAELEVA